MCALLVKGGSILSIGYNRNSPGVLKNPHYKFCKIHAELDCFLNLNLTKSQLSNCKLYIAGTNRSKQNITSKPCPTCQDMLIKIGIKYVYYYDAGIPAKLKLS